jgi:hypothetical protein
VGQGTPAVVHEGIALRALLSAAKLVYGRGVSESLYPLSPVTVPMTSPMTVTQPEAPDDAGDAGRAPKVAPPDPPRSAPITQARRSERSRGFAFHVEGFGELGCGDVRGFREAALAAVDPRAAMPSRLVLVGPDAELRDWLLAFAEDTEQVRRALTIHRRFDGKSIRAVVTISTFGYGVETSLAVESVSAPRAEGDDEDIFRSGVHLKTDIEAALARHDAGFGTARESGAPALVGAAWASEVGLGDFD